MSTTSVQVDIQGKTMTLSTGLLAKQANGTVTAQIGETILLSAVVAAPEPREGIDFFPLQVEYREKFYAAGRFPGGYFKREARPSEKEILTMRLADRPLRPLFPEGYHNEVQIHNMVMSADGVNEPDVMSVNAASAALMISEIPFNGPVGAVRVGYVDGQYVANPSHEDLEKSEIDLVYVGWRDLPIMIEGSGKEVSEELMIGAMKFAHPFAARIMEAQLELRRQLGLPAKEVVQTPVDQTLLQKARELAGDKLQQALLVAGKQDRHNQVTEIKTALFAQLQEIEPTLEMPKYKGIFDALEIEKVRENVLKHGKRIDGRGSDDLRPLAGQVGLLPRTHGSSLFNRGETQALGVVTLGTLQDMQSMDAVTGGESEKSFMLHYNFPPYSTGEVRRMMGTSRREIGHGDLAERSIAQVMPDEYPYTVRVVSEVMGSNGSSSMASVCAGTLALMDAGVPIKRPVAGISIGLFTGDDKAILVTDILGAEDHCGDMDFKVAGTSKGITGFQVDLKITGLPWDLVEGAFQKAKDARAKILDYMASVLPAPRAELSPYAPRIHSMTIDTEKIGALIGPGGKNIRGITERTGTQIDIQDDGTVRIFSTDAAGLEAAIQEVSALTAEAEIGKIYRGKVTGIKEFGAFVEILPGKDGLVHISQLADFRVNAVEDVCSMGDYMWVKCIGVDDRGKIKLSRKEALAEKGSEAEG